MRPDGESFAVQSLGPREGRAPLWGERRALGLDRLAKWSLSGAVKLGSDTKRIERGPLKVVRLPLCEQNLRECSSNEPLLEQIGEECSCIAPLFEHNRRKCLDTAT